MKKRVSFATTQTAYCNPHQLTVEERKQLCWYTENELNPSRNDAREAMEILQSSSGTCFVRLVPADVCIRGIEKYADTMAKVTGQRRLIQSVLDQQKKCPPETLGEISRYLSQPFKDLARYFASRSLDEDASDDRSETTEVDPASNNANLMVDEDASDDRSETTEVDANTTASSMKRSLSYSSEEEEQNDANTSVKEHPMHQRNVKPMIQYCSE